MTPEQGRDRPAGFRYGAVLILTFLILVLQIALPSADWSRAIALGLESAALVVVVATARERAVVRRARTLLVSAVALVLVVLEAVGVLPAVFTYALGGLMGVVIPFALIGGLVKLIRARGVNAQVVAGALVIYLLVGLAFGWTVGAVAHASSGSYFAQGTDGTQSDRVYFSFTTLSTTGYGDFTPATRGGRALAVVEMLFGQLYLVTVIGILVGNLASRRRA